MEIVTWALNKLMMLGKINAKCAMEVFHPSLLFLIHINHEEYNWGMEGSLGPYLCEKSGFYTT